MSLDQKKLAAAALLANLEIGFERGEGEDVRLRGGFEPTLPGGGEMAFGWRRVERP